MTAGFVANLVQLYFLASKRLLQFELMSLGMILQSHFRLRLRLRDPVQGCVQSPVHAGANRHSSPILYQKEIQVSRNNANSVSS